MSENEIKLPEGLSVEEATDVLREYGTTDEAQIVNSETHDSLKAEIEEAKKAFAAVLAEESPQSADTLSRQDMDALTEPFRDEEGEIDVDTLRQIPETGDVGGDGGEGNEGGGGGGSGGFSVDTLGHSEVEELKMLKRKRNAFESRGVDDRVDALESEMADIAGVDEFDEIEMEAL